MHLSRSLLTLRRLEMDFSRHGVPEIPLLGRYNHTRAETAVPEHTHGDILEICFLVKGRQTYRVGGRDYHLRGGDIFVAFPNEQHSSAGNPQEKGVLYWMMIRKKGKNLFGLSPSQSGLLWQSLCRLSSRHFRGSRKMNEQLNTLTTLFHGPAFPLRPAAMASEGLAFLLEVVRCEALKERGRGRTGRMESVYRYIQEHLEESFRVPDLARQAGLSVPRFKARFKEETGVPPGEYVLRAKIEEAKKRLASGSVTQVAYSLGFSSSQYFATVFKRFTGKTPGMERSMAGK